MPISVPGSKRPPDSRGFTLVELMVVVTVIGLASAAAVLAMPDPRGRLADEGTRFAARVRAAQDSAIIEARPVSVWVTPGGYGFDRWQAGGWRAVDEKPMRVERWSDGTSAAVTNRVRLSFDATGMADRAIDVPLQRDRARVTISIAADGSVRVDG